MSVAFDLPPPVLVAPAATERLQAAAGTVSQPDTSPVRLLRCKMTRPPPLIPQSFTIAYRIGAAEVRDFALPKPAPRVFAQIDELTQSRVAVSWTLDGFSALYIGSHGFDEVKYRATYVAASGGVFVQATPTTSDFSDRMRDDTQRASGTCQRLE